MKTGGATSNNVETCRARHINVDSSNSIQKNGNGDYNNKISWWAGATRIGFPKATVLPVTLTCIQLGSLLLKV